MKKQLAVIVALVAISISASAQKEYKLAKSSGKLNLNIGGAIVEGYNGKEIIFSSSKSDNDVTDERAKGLRIISGSGFTDNTGMGIDVTEKGEEVNVNTVRKGLNNGIITIKVPQNIKIALNNAAINQDELILRNLKNEIEISVSYNKIKLENNTGPMNVKSLYGSIDASFAGEIKGPVSIISVYGYVDVSMPVSTKANIEMGTSYGNLYAGEGFKIAVEKSTGEKSESSSGYGTVQALTTTGRVFGTPLNVINSKGAVNVGSFIREDRESLKGKLNGGGADVILKSNYKNVYLREK